MILVVELVLVVAAVAVAAVVLRLVGRSMGYGGDWSHATLIFYIFC